MTHREGDLPKGDPSLGIVSDALAKGRMQPGWLRAWNALTSLVEQLRAGFSFLTALEIAALALIAAVYGFSLLNFDPNVGLMSGENQVQIGSMTLINRWLSGEIDFPLWNPIIGYGRSLIADPFLFAFNPFASLPMALLGAANGAKLAALLNFFIAGMGAWLLCRLLGFSRLTRIWCSLLYMMSGAIAAHLTAVQIQLAFSLGWLPWSVAGLVWVIKSRSLLAIALASVAQALFYFAGNLYYQVYGLFALLIICLVFIVDWKDFQLKWEIARRILLMGALSVGLIAIQFLPMASALPSIRNTGGYIEGDQSFSGSQLPEYAFLNYLISDPEYSKDPVLGKIAIPQENYRYIGVAPIQALLFLVPAYRRGDRAEILAFGLGFLFLLAWASIRYSFVKQLYEFLPVLYQFRFPGRALSAGALFLLVLSGYGLDHLWHSLCAARDRAGSAGESSARRLPKLATFVASAALLLGLLLGLRRVFLANRDMIVTKWIHKAEPGLAVEWLLRQDRRDQAIDATYTISDSIALAAFEHDIRSLSFREGWRPTDAPYTLGRRDAIPMLPAYRFDWEWDNFSSAEYQLVDQIGELRIWEALDRYPYAFVFPTERLLLTQPVLPAEVRPAYKYARLGPNRIAVDLDAVEDSVLVISESWFTGWKVWVNDRPGKVVSVSSFLAVEVPPGRHEVLFEYAPTSFTIGLIISAATLLIIAGIALQSLMIAVWRRLD